MPEQQGAQRTQVNPKGLAKLYLRNAELDAFFSAQRLYFEAEAQRTKRGHLRTQIITLALLLFFAFVLWDAIDDEEAVMGFLIMGAFFSLFAFFGIYAYYAGKRNHFQKLRGKGVMLHQFFIQIQDDIHPESGIKGFIDHRKHQSKHRYKSKTSPHSGAKKHYYKYPWAILKFSLMDGSSVRLKCVDKVKEKSSSIVRFEALHKGRLQPNDLLYEIDAGQILNFRQSLCHTESDLRESPEKCGLKMARSFKQSYKHLVFRPSPKDVEEESTPELTQATPAQRKQQLEHLEHLLIASEIEGLRFERLDDIFELRFPLNASEHTLWLELGETDGESFVSVRMALLGDAPSVEKLLKANPALAYGRFAYFKSPNTGRRQLNLVKPLLFRMLDQPELETAILGVARLGGKLGEMKRLPQKIRAYRAERHPQWERMLLDNALQDLRVDIQSQEKKHKLRVTLPDGRQQTVHVRFDREDLDGYQLISLLSYCGHQSRELYETALEENIQASYGAIGLARLGEEEMFVVSDSQLADTADPPEIRNAVLQVASKADALESLLGDGSDVH